MSDSTPDNLASRVRFLESRVTHIEGKIFGLVPSENRVKAEKCTHGFNEGTCCYRATETHKNELHEKISDALWGDTSKKEKPLDYDKLANETRILFREWVKKLTDDDIDKIVGVPPKPEAPEKVEERTLSEKFTIAQIEWARSPIEYSLMSKLAEIATEHFKEKGR